MAGAAATGAAAPSAEPDAGGATHCAGFAGEEQAARARARASESVRTPDHKRGQRPVQLSMQVIVVVVSQVVLWHSSLAPQLVPPAFVATHAPVEPLPPKSQ